VSSFSDSATLVAALVLLACSREDIELAPPADEPLPAEDCSAEVTEGLLGARPAMGWNGYNTYSECDTTLDEALVRANVDALVASGMQSAGYQYVNLDLCWQTARSSDGLRTFDPIRLPGGIELLANDVHALGLSLGVWQPDADCRQDPGGAGFESVDAATYAGWGVDYVKYVRCATTEPIQASASALARALTETGRDMVLSLSASPFQEWMRDTTQLWRTSGDIEATWASIVSQIDATVPLAAYARPGAFNDPDMLEVGNGELTQTEMRTHFSVWSILSAPLIAGNDLTMMSDEIVETLTNGRVIALNQDPLGLQAALVRREGEIEILAKPLAQCGARGVVVWNRGEAPGNVSLSLDELWLERENVVVQDLWSGVEEEMGPDDLSVTVPSHGAVALRVTGREPPLPRGRVYLSDLRFTYATNGFGPVELDTTNGEAAALDGQPIRLRGAAYDKGLGVHGPSLIRYRLGRRCSRFDADVGIDDDQGGRGSAQFEVWADGERLYPSGVLTGASPARSVSVDVSNRRELRLFVGIGGDTDALDHAVWAGARLECEAGG
jgi:alpha-galactosidase